MLPAPNDPPLPTASLDTLFSYYPYFPISARQRAHASLRASPYPPPSCSTSRPTPTPSERRRDARRAVARASLRALRGERPAGVSIGLDAADLSDEEEAIEEDKAQVNAFGHRFLLPFGRRLTQMEMEAAPSPTPSDHDHEHRQEDHQHGAGSPLPAPSEHGGDNTEAVVVDLDASMEDRDVTGTGADPSTEYDPDRSTEYDSDDLRLMRNMDNSVGSETPESHEEESDGDIVEVEEEE